MFEHRSNYVPTLWAVLSILLNTQDVTHEYVKCLQEEYKHILRRQIERLHAEVRKTVGRTSEPHV